MRFDPDGGSLAYYATDTRASGFLVGAALAWVWRPPAWSRPLPRAARWGIDAAGIVAVVTLVVGFVAVSEFDGGLYRQGGFLRVGMLAAVVIVAATRAAGCWLRCCRGRCWSPSDAGPTGSTSIIGRSSCSVASCRSPRGRSMLLGVLVTVAVAEASYRWIETPVRRGGWQR